MALATRIISPELRTRQDWTQYTTTDHLAWHTLFDRRIADLQANASRVFHEGMHRIELPQEVVPELSALNKLLRPATGWSAVAVKGYLPAEDFFRCLAVRRFPTTITIRPMHSLDYIPEPDIFHDVFGHVPMHAHPVYADFLQRFGEIASREMSEEMRQKLTRLFWFTVEFGLIRENGRVKVYGSGLISSAADCANSLSDKCRREPFSLDAVLEQGFVIDKLQDVLFVIDEYQQLFEAVTELEARLA